ncbi:MAG: hypothetical protein ACRELB_23405 [Polyangiaceae bacterium]
MSNPLMAALREMARQGVRQLAGDSGPQQQEVTPHEANERVARAEDSRMVSAPGGLTLGIVVAIILLPFGI